MACSEKRRTGRRGVYVGPIGVKNGERESADLIMGSGSVMSSYDQSVNHSS